MDTHAESLAAATGSAGVWGRIAATMALLFALLLCLPACAVNFYVVPKFEKIFADLGTALPSMTVLAVAASRLSRNCWFVAIPLALIVYGGLGLLIWRVDWKSGLAVAIALALLLLAYLFLVVFAMFAPLAGIVHSVRGGP